MRNEKEFKRDTYCLDLAKEVSIFIMMAYSYQNEFMIDHFGLSLIFLIIPFVFMPRVIINQSLDENIEGTREIRAMEYPGRIKKINKTLNILKFISLILLATFCYANKWAMENFGLFLLWAVTCFMVIPRKLILMILSEVEEDFQQNEC